MAQSNAHPAHITELQGAASSAAQLAWPVTAHNN